MLIAVWINCIFLSTVPRITMSSEAGTAPAHARRNWSKTSGRESLYGKSFTTDESVLDRLVAGRAVAPRRSTRAQKTLAKENPNCLRWIAWWQVSPHITLDGRAMVLQGPTSTTIKESTIIRRGNRMIGTT